jgi:hypothetical protein
VAALKVAISAHINLSRECPAIGTNLRIVPTANPSSGWRSPCFPGLPSVPLTFSSPRGFERGVPWPRNAVGGTISGGHSALYRKDYEHLFGLTAKQSHAPSERQFGHLTYLVFAPEAANHRANAYSTVSTGSKSTAAKAPQSQRWRIARASTPGSHPAQTHLRSQFEGMYPVSGALILPRIVANSTEPQHFGAPPPQNREEFEVKRAAGRHRARGPADKTAIAGDGGALHVPKYLCS